MAIILASLVLNVVSLLHLKSKIRQNNKIQTSMNRQKDGKIAAVYTLILITCFYLICFVPYQSIGFFTQISTFPPCYMEYPYASLEILSFGNSGINSLIFIVRTKEIKNILKSWFCNLACRRSTKIGNKIEMR